MLCGIPIYIHFFFFNIKISFVSLAKAQPTNTNRPVRKGTAVWCQLTQWCLCCHWLHCSGNKGVSWEPTKGSRWITKYDRTCRYGLHRVGTENALASLTPDSWTEVQRLSLLTASLITSRQSLHQPEWRFCRLLDLGMYKSRCIDKTLNCLFSQTKTFSFYFAPQLSGSFLSFLWQMCCL